MSRRKDQAIVDHVTAHPTRVERNVITVAKALGMDIVELRAIVHESTRLRMLSMGDPGWHVIELLP